MGTVSTEPAAAPKRKYENRNRLFIIYDLKLNNRRAIIVIKIVIL